MRGDNVIVDLLQQRAFLYRELEGCKTLTWLSATCSWHTSTLLLDALDSEWFTGTL